MSWMAPCIDHGAATGEDQGRDRFSWKAFVRGAEAQLDDVDVLPLEGTRQELRPDTALR